MTVDDITNLMNGLNSVSPIQWFEKNRIQGHVMYRTKHKGLEDDRLVFSIPEDGSTINIKLIYDTGNMEIGWIPDNAKDFKHLARMSNIHLPIKFKTRSATKDFKDIEELGKFLGTEELTPKFFGV